MQPNFVNRDGSLVLSISLYLMLPTHPDKRNAPDVHICGGDT